MAGREVIDSGVIRNRLARELPDWTVADGEICRVYALGDWKTVMDAVRAIDPLAEAADHHPDLLVGYGRLEVRLTTHDAGGVTEKDFQLAAQIERVVNP